MQLGQVVGWHLDEGEREDRVAAEVGRPQLEHAGEARCEALIVNRLDLRQLDRTRQVGDDQRRGAPPVSAAIRAQSGRSPSR